jgi:hypothetical protein
MNIFSANNKILKSIKLIACVSYHTSIGYCLKASWANQKLIDIINEEESDIRHALPVEVHELCPPSGWVNPTDTINCVLDL